MDAPVEPADRDRRRASRDRRQRLSDRRHFWPRFVPAGSMGRVVRWFTGPWSSANGMSWLRLFFLFLIVRWGVLTIYSIPSRSMEPALHGAPSFITRDRVAVNKLAFGPRVPFTAQRIFATGSPKRWDIVVFDSPQVTEEGDVLVKRVVGLPGDVVNIRPAGLYINNVRVDPPADLAGKLHYTAALAATNDAVNRLALNWAKSGLIPLEVSEGTSPAHAQLKTELKKLGRELMDVEVAHLGLQQAAQRAETLSPETLALIREWWQKRINRTDPARFGVSGALVTTLVPQGHYFVMGDNGPESVDSRMFGWVPHENLIGRVFAIVTPLSRTRDLSGFLETPRGRLIFYGTIAVIIAWEVIPGFVLFSWKLRGAIPSLGLKLGDHVLVDRLRYGPRIPFTNHRWIWWRTPAAGEVVCFLMSRAANAFDLYFGEVLEVDRTSGLRVIVRGPGTGDARRLVLRRRDIVGRTRSVWRPRGRRGRIHPVPQVESGHDDRLH